MKLLKSILVPIIICTIFLLSIQPLKWYNEIWMLFSYGCHIIALILSFVLYIISYNKTSSYCLGWHLCIVIFLIIISLYPFYFMSSNLTDILSYCFDIYFKVYEGGVLVSICTLATELILIAALINCVSDIRKQNKTIKNKFQFISGLFLPIFLGLGYMSILYINNAIEKNNQSKKHAELEKIAKIEQAKRDSINNELIKKHVDLSFGRYQLGTNKLNGKTETEQLCGEKIESVRVKEHNGIIYKIIVSLEPMYSSSFISKAVELYSKKYGETGTYGIWDFKNGRIEIKKVGTTTKREKERYIHGLRGVYASEAERWIDVKYDIVNIIYIDHKIDSIAKQEELLKEKQRIKEYEERQEVEEREREIEAERQKQREHEMI